LEENDVENMTSRELQEAIKEANDLQLQLDILHETADKAEQDAKAAAIEKENAPEADKYRGAIIAACNRVIQTLGGSAAAEKR